MRKPKRLKKDKRYNIGLFLFIASLLSGCMLISALFCSQFTKKLLATYTQEPYGATVYSFYYKLDMIYLDLLKNIDEISKFETTLQTHYEEAEVAKVCSKANKAYNKFSEEYEKLSVLENNVNALASKYDEICTSLQEYLDSLDPSILDGFEYKDWVQEKKDSIAKLLSDYEETKNHYAELEQKTKKIADDFFSEYFDPMSRLVNAECGTYYVPPEDRYNVCNVVENRIESDKFPNNLHDVIYQGSDGSGPVAYAPTVDGSINLPATEDVKEDVENYLRGRVETGMPSDVVFQSKDKQGDYVWKYMEVTGHYFCGKK